MKRLDLGALAACLIAAPALATGALAAPQPTTPPPGPGSLSGVWMKSTFSTVRTGPPVGETTISRAENGEGPPPLQPWAKALAEKRIADANAGRPYATTKSRCLPGGTPSSMSPPAQLPIQIIESADQVTVLFEEFNHFRIIRLNQPHAEDPDPGYFGDSVARWEGDSLVVDTVGLNDETTVDGVVPHSDQLHVVERIKRTGPDTLEILATLTDPKAFTSPWTRKYSFKRVDGIRVQEYFCENERNAPDQHGNTGVQLSSQDR